MDLSLEEIILQKKIQKPQLANDDGDKKQKSKLNGWVKQSGAAKLKRKRQKVIGAVTKSGEDLSGVTKAVGKFVVNTEPTKLIVSNLDYKLVNDSDILSLFSKFGPIKKAGVHYDKNGQSQGSAEVVYERHTDAIKAMSSYKGMTLDGRELIIQLAISEIPAMNPARLSVKNGGNGVFKNKTNQKNGSHWNVKINGDKEVSIEDLDAELDEYIKNRI